MTSCTTPLSTTSSALTGRQWHQFTESPMARGLTSTQPSHSWRNGTRSGVCDRHQLRVVAIGSWLPGRCSGIALHRLARRARKFLRRTVRVAIGLQRSPAGIDQGKAWTKVIGLAAVRRFVFRLGSTSIPQIGSLAHWVELRCASEPTERCCPVWRSTRCWTDLFAVSIIP